METQVRTPQAIFMQPQRLLVPLFQRPYVWNEELQWEPLWRDLERVASRILAAPNAPQVPHFLGAVVLQQLTNSTSDLQQRTVIDGQQRLTTLQILLDALHAEAAQAGAKLPAARLEPLIANAEAFCKSKEDRFKVWPTNRDRPAFNEVMDADSPVDYAKLTHRTARLVKAHEYFANQSRVWLRTDGEDAVLVRAEAIERAARELLQIVVIDLTASENAQEIFETLNARGAVLTAADLIKNFVFQRLLEQKADVEAAYAKYWEQFETAFWEADVSLGRLTYPRSSVFLNHWLIAQTGSEVVAREVFSRFKHYADFESNLSMLDLLKEVHRSAQIYRAFIEKGEVLEGPLDRVGLFTYRARALESEVVKPVLLALLDHPSGSLPANEVSSTLDTIESWMARRMLVRATAQSYNTIMPRIASIVRNAAPGQIGETVREFIRSQKSETSYWPDDDELRKVLSVMPVYRKLSRSRLRMVLEAVEDHLRGWIPGQMSTAGIRIPRGSFAIEHIMPQAWQKHWPLTAGVAEHERDERIHRLGNLTLLTARLNGAVSHGPWLGVNGKADHLQAKDVVLLNSRLLKENRDTQWDEAGIDARTSSIIESIVRIWPVPPGHKATVQHEHVGSSIAVEVADLVGAGLLHVGQVLHSNPGAHTGRTVIVLSDGRLEMDGKTFDSLSRAAIEVRKKATNGWLFWRVNPNGKTSLADLRSQYLSKVEGGDAEAVEDAVDA